MWKEEEEEEEHEQFLSVITQIWLAALENSSTSATTSHMMKKPDY